MKRRKVVGLRKLARHLLLLLMERGTAGLRGGRAAVAQRRGDLDVAQRGRDKVVVMVRWWRAEVIHGGIVDGGHDKLDGGQLFLANSA